MREAPLLERPQRMIWVQVEESEGKEGEEPEVRNMNLESLEFKTLVTINRKKRWKSRSLRCTAACFCLLSHTLGHCKLSSQCIMSWVPAQQGAWAEVNI